MDQIKLCINCAHYVAAEGFRPPRCGRTSRTSLVDGEVSMVACNIERAINSSKRCGTEGKFWEERDSDLPF